MYIERGELGPPCGGFFRLISHRARVESDAAAACAAGNRHQRGRRDEVVCCTRQLQGSRICGLTLTPPFHASRE